MTGHALKLTALWGAVLVLAACETAAPPADPLVAPLVGRTLVNDGAAIRVNADGTLSGTVGRSDPQPIVGRWAVRDGQWCRTITAPERAAGTECQTVSIVGDQARFEAPGGRSTEFAIQ